MTPKQPALTPGNYFHIYNRGNGKQQVFRKDSDYEMFRHKWERFIEPVAITLAYSLIPNHFHAVTRVREIAQIMHNDEPVVVTEALMLKYLPSLFVSFSKSMHNKYGTDGAVFKRPVQRKLIDSESYLKNSIAYVLLNAFSHGLVEDYRDHRYSSFATLQGAAPQIVDWNAVREIFESEEALMTFLEARAERGRSRDTDPSDLQI